MIILAGIFSVLGESMPTTTWIAPRATLLLLRRYVAIASDPWFARQVTPTSDAGEAAAKCAAF